MARGEGARGEGGGLFRRRRELSAPVYGVPTSTASDAVPSTPWDESPEPDDVVDDAPSIMTERPWAQGVDPAYDPWAVDRSVSAHPVSTTTLPTGGLPLRQVRDLGEMPEPDDIYVEVEPDYAAWEEYLIPNLREDVLRNKLATEDEPYGVEDIETLQRREEAFTATRMVELLERPIPGNFDYAHMRAIHKHLFQDVYEWAGEQRTVDLNKAGHQYITRSLVEPLWKRQHDALMDEGLLRGIDDPEEFSERFAAYWGMVNFAHAFREGNTRSQTMFFAQLADEAGWTLDVTRLDPEHPHSLREDFVAARFHHQSAGGFDHVPLAKVLAQALTKNDRQDHLTRHPGKDLGSVPHRLADAPSAAMTREEVHEAVETTVSSMLRERYQRFPELRADYVVEGQPIGRYETGRGDPVLGDPDDPTDSMDYSSDEDDESPEPY